MWPVALIGLGLLLLVLAAVLLAPSLRGNFGGDEDASLPAETPGAGVAAPGLPMDAGVARRPFCAEPAATPRSPAGDAAGT